MKQVLGQMGIEGQPNVIFFDRHKNLWASIPNKGVVAYNMQQQLLYEFGYTDDSHGVPQGAILVTRTTVTEYLKELFALSESVATVPSSSMKTAEWFAATLCTNSIPSGLPTTLPSNT